MSKVHNGVLIPAGLEQATTADLDAYASSVKAANRVLIAAIHAVEDRALELGVELDA